MNSCLKQNCTSLIRGSSSSIFTQLIQTLMVAQCGLGRIDNYPQERTPEIVSNIEGSFDFVIVGGGSAGSVLAARLSEHCDWKVLLIEAGTYPSAMSDIPAVFLQLQGTSEDYDFQAERQSNFCLGMVNKRCRLAGGKVLGGSSVINGMLYSYGNKEDYDSWAAQGNEDWGYEDLLPYFKKSVNYPREITEKYGDKYLGSDGPLSVRLFNYTSSLFQEIVMKAAAEKGIPKLDVLNTDRFIGFGRGHVTVDEGRRVNAAKAFLSHIKNRKNLYVMTSTRADKILISDNRATGVQVTLKDGCTINLKASKEVIVSAGTMGSPKLLMLSGIGRKNDLNKLKIKCIADLPVGKNYQDHILWHAVNFEFKNRSHVDKNYSDSLDDAYEYLAHNNGEFASIGSDLFGYINVLDPTSIYPNVKFSITYVPHGDTKTMKTVLNATGLSRKIQRSIIKSTMTNDNVLMTIILLKPRSIGEVKLRSNLPSEPVKIFTNFLTDERDKEILLEAVNFTKSLINTKAFRNLGVKLRNVTIPGCHDLEFDSYEYWECHLRHVARSTYHSVGTVRMGTPDNPKSVVDFKLKVLGIDRLRVIDASIMPDVTSGNTYAPTLMISEKGSDLIKDYWLNRN